MMFQPSRIFDKITFDMEDQSQGVVIKGYHMSHSEQQNIQILITSIQKEDK